MRDSLSEVRIKKTSRDKIMPVLKHRLSIKASQLITVEIHS